MLSLTLNEGEYLTIGDKIVVRVDRLKDGRCKLSINAPRELSILRGEVLERQGGARPGCIQPKSSVSNG